MSFKIIEILEPATSSPSNWESVRYYNKIEPDENGYLRIFTTDNPLNATRIRVDTDKDRAKVLTLIELIKKFVPKSYKISVKEIDIQLNTVKLN